MENTIIGAVLLCLTGEICRQRPQVLRLVAGSIMCGAFSLVMFLGARPLMMFFMEILFAVCVCIVVFGRWRKAIVFILVTYFMGGMVMGLFLVTKQQGIYTATGIYTGDIKAALLVLFVGAGYMAIKNIINMIRNKKLYTEHSFEVEIIISEHRISASAFLDTGNRLTDPLTGKPAAVASENLWQSIEAALKSEEEAFGDVRFAVIPYEAVGSKGILNAVRTDYIEIGDKKIKGCLIARAEKDFAFGKSADDEKIYDLLISGEMI